MRHLSSLLCLTLVCALSGCGPARRDPAADVDRLMNAYTGAMPGAAVLVIRDGKAVVQRGYGLANLENHVPVTPATNFRLASMTKQFTAAAVLLLAQDGRLSLDDSVRRWLPGLPEAAQGITLRHMLTHTSGLIDYEDLIPAGTTEQLHDADVLRLLSAENRTYFAPGSHYRYSDSGYSLLSLVVQQAAGMDFATFLHRRIFEPLKMLHSVAYEAGRSDVDNRAFGYSAGATGWARTDQSLTSAVLGDGGIYSSIEDLARWDAALYDDRLLSAASLRAAFTPATPTDDPAVRYGFGWRLTGESVWHSGETLGFRNVIVRFPAAHCTVIVLTNRNDPEPYPLALQIARLFVSGADRVHATHSVEGPDSGAHRLPPEAH